MKRPKINIEKKSCLQITDSGYRILDTGFWIPVPISRLLSAACFLLTDFFRFGTHDAGLQTSVFFFSFCSSTLNNHWLNLVNPFNFRTVTGNLQSRRNVETRKSCTPGVGGIAKTTNSSKAQHYYAGGWNMFEVTSGLNSIVLRKEKGVARCDKIHFTGDLVPDDLFLNTLMKNFGSYLLNKNQLTQNCHFEESMTEKPVEKEEISPCTSSK